MPSDAIYRTVVEDQTEIIRRFRPDGRLTFVNSALCRFYGKTREELLGTYFQDLLRPGEREEIAGQLFALTPENPEAVTEPGFVDAEGNVRYVQYITRAIFDVDGNTLEYQSVGRDVTAQRQAEATLAEARAAMERASQVTTLAVIGGGIAHEINQPLNAIRLLTASALLLKERPEPPRTEIIRMLNEIAAQVDRIDAIVNHVRAHLRNSQTAALEPCDLEQTVHAALTLMQTQILSRGITLEIDAAPNLPAVLGSCIRFEQLVTNLVANAMQALDTCESCSKTICIGLAMANADHVELTIFDNGPGFDPKLIERIFEPFFTTKSLGTSMGLGLCIAQNIVQAAGGSIMAENRSHGGALLRVHLPVVH